MASLAIQILLEHPEFVMLNQQRNPANPQAHREATALEILRDFAGQPPRTSSSLALELVDISRVLERC